MMTDDDESDENAADKKIRPDRSEKLKERKNHKETVIKSSIQKYLIGNKACVLNAITSRVDAFSKRANLASISLCTLLKEILHGSLFSEIPNVFNQTLIRQLMLGTKSTHDPIPCVHEHLTRHPYLLYKGPRHLGDRNIYSAGTKKYITNLKNALKLNFEPRMKKYLRQLQKIHEFSDDQRIVALYSIMGWKKIPKTMKNVQLPKVLTNALEQQRRILRVSEKQEISNAWFKNEQNLLNVIRQNVFYNQFRARHDLPLFCIIPISSIRHLFISLDTSCIFGLMKECKLIDQKMNEDTFESLVDEQWTSLIALNRITKHFKNSPDVANSKFTHLIETDGISMCCHFSKEKTEYEKLSKKEKELQRPEIIINEETDRVLGIDPGRVNIYTVVEKGINGMFKSYTLTRKQYYSDSGMNDAKKSSEKWNNSIKLTLQNMSKVSIKGACISNHFEYLKVYLQNYESLWNEYSKSRWGRQRLRLYGGKKRTFARFWNRIINDGDKTKRIVANYGNAKFPSGGKGEISVPTTRACKECAIRCVINPIDEFRTSKVFWENDSILKGIYFKKSKRNKNAAKKSLRGLLWCDSTKTNNFEGKFVNRDINAAINMYRCGVDSNRPEILKRNEANTKLAFIISKQIKDNKKY